MAYGWLLKWCYDGDDDADDNNVDDEDGFGSGDNQSKPGICFHYHCAVYDECKYSDTFWLEDRTRLFVQYIISLSSLCKLIWRHWTDKMPVRYILSSVWVRLSIFSPLSIIQYVGLYVFSLPISLVIIVIIKTEVWTITHCLGLGHKTMASAVCLSIFLF